MMKFPKFSEEDSSFLSSVMDAVIREVLANELPIAPEEIAERFAAAALSGERDFNRLKALTLGAENAQAGSDWLLAN